MGLRVRRELGGRRKRERSGKLGADNETANWSLRSETKSARRRASRLMPMGETRGGGRLDSYNDHVH